MSDEDDEQGWTPDELEAGLDRWEAELRAQGHTPRTIKTYVRDARAFVAFVTGRDGARRAADAGQPNARRARPARAGAAGPIDVPARLQAVFDRWASVGRPPQRAFPWPRDRWLAAKRHEAYFEGLPDELDRAAVAARCVGAREDAARALEAFLVTNAWGRGETPYGPDRVTRILDHSLDAADRLRDVAATLIADGAVAAYTRLQGDRSIWGFGETYGTKYLYFCQPADHRPRALILDERVRAWLRENGRPDLDRSGLWSVRRYTAYLEQAHMWAAALDCAPDDVEFLIFADVARQKGDRWAEDWWRDGARR